MKRTTDESRACPRIFVAGHDSSPGGLVPLEYLRGNHALANETRFDLLISEVESRQNANRFKQNASSKKARTLVVQWLN